jgi:tRNA A-37 threonylcarbamoyl transferase component Bud32
LSLSSGGGSAQVTMHAGGSGPSDLPDAPPSELFRVGRQVGQYELLEEIGRGGMGIVYRARHVKLKRVVALKMLLPGRNTRNDTMGRFRREAEAVARLRHPNIVQIYEVGEVAGIPWFSLEYIGGGSLEMRINATPQPAASSAALVSRLARAMQVAHEHGIIHRDIKPANVLLESASKGSVNVTPGDDAPRLDDDDLKPKITDFGLAKHLEVEGQTVAGQIMGTPSYMAPEQAGGHNQQVGPASDVYGLCALLYELLTGRPPFKGSSHWGTISMVLLTDPIPPGRLNSAVPRDLETICLKGLRKEPDKRYRSSAELADDLDRFAAGRPVLARPAPLWERTVKWVRRQPTQAALALAVLLTIAAGVASALFYARSQRQQAEYEKQQTLYEKQKTLSEQQTAADLRRQLEARRKVDQLQEEGRRHEESGDLSAAFNLWGQALTLLDADPGADQETLRHDLQQRRERVRRALEERQERERQEQRLKAEQLAEVAARDDALDRARRCLDHCNRAAFHEISVFRDEEPRSRRRRPRAKRPARRRGARCACWTRRRIWLVPISCRCRGRCRSGGRSVLSASATRKRPRRSGGGPATCPAPPWITSAPPWATPARAASKTPPAAVRAPCGKSRARSGRTICKRSAVCGIRRLAGPRPSWP